MKKLVLFTVLAVAMFSCGGNKKAETKPSDGTLLASASATSDSQVYELDSLINVAEQKLEKEVKVAGYVTHTCKHSGKRCFIVGESQTASMRIEAKGEIGGFNRELVGSKIEVTGVVKERRLTKEYIDQMEKDVTVKQEEDATAESCAAELSNISDMRKWMKDNNREYYSIFYMDGTKYDVIN
ncbi:MAG: hypothetical protein LBN37_03985 [Bacteroidales bacterium]|jgi:hypothetical protein|nr:hypothetical protein [Bacteroidales bacterium]